MFVLHFGHLGLPINSKQDIFCKGPSKEHCFTLLSNGLGIIHIYFHHMALSSTLNLLCVAAIFDFRLTQTIKGPSNDYSCTVWVQ